MKDHTEDVQELENKLIFEINHKQPIELTDLSDSLYGLAEQYKRFVVSHSTDPQVRDARLYVREVRKGSIIVELQDMLPVVLMADVNALLQFGLYLLKIYDFFLGKLKDRPAVDKVDLEQCSSILKPVAKDDAAQLNVAINYNAEVKNIFSLNYENANAIQNTIGREIGSLAAPRHRVHQKVLMYWHQAKNDPTATTGDKAIIEGITRRPIKVIFENDEMKSKLLQDPHNIFLRAYIVDVVVETINDLPALYKVTHIHETFDRELPPHQQ